VAPTEERDRQIDETMAREAIRDLVARYNSTSDSGRFEQLFELFAADAVMETADMGGELTRYETIDGIARIFSGAKDRLVARPDPLAPAYLRHFTATHQIDLVDADHASGRLYFQVLMAHGLDHWGRYIDKYVRIGGRWRFAHRKVFVDGRVERSWFAGGPSEGGEGE
jgi:3-phenylpropionate/cinnamic acid dioxygenase small subunit